MAKRDNNRKGSKKTMFHGLVNKMLSDKLRQMKSDKPDFFVDMNLIEGCHAVLSGGTIQRLEPEAVRALSGTFALLGPTRPDAFLRFNETKPRQLCYELASAMLPDRSKHSITGIYDRANFLPSIRLLAFENCGNGLTAFIRSEERILSVLNGDCTDNFLLSGLHLAERLLGEGSFERRIYGSSMPDGDFQFRQYSLEPCISDTYVFDRFLKEER